MIGCAAAEQCEIWQAVGEGAVFWKGRWEFCLDEAGPFLAGPADEEIGAFAVNEDMAASEDETLGDEEAGAGEGFRAVAAEDDSRGAAADGGLGAC